MAIFNKKKSNEQDNKPAENKAGKISDEMKVILEAREEDQQEKQARAEERQQAQEAADKQFEMTEKQAAMASAKILDGEITPAGMTFFIVCDEVPEGAAPAKEGNIIVRGNVRGTVKKGSEVFLYQGYGDKFTVKIESIKNVMRESVDELKDDRAELEITRGDIPQPSDPDEDASRPVMRFAVITDGKGIDDMSDPSCRGMATAGNPRTTAMLCEYGRFGKEPVFFGTTMDCIMTSEFVTLAKIIPAKNGKSSVGFVGISPKNEPDVSYLPVFTDNRLANNALKGGFAQDNGPDKKLVMNFAQVAAVARDESHEGFIVNPGGPVTITIPRKLINDMVRTRVFKQRFGEGAADNASRVLGGTGNRELDDFIANGGPDVPGVKRLLIRNPSDTPEFDAIEKAVKAYCGSHADIAKLLILVAAPDDNPNDKSYFCIIDCPDHSIQDECKGVAEAMKPYLKEIRKIQFQQFSKIGKDNFPDKVKWLYSKLPL